MKIDKLSIKGFKSIQNLEEFPLGDLNVLIGANGSGKSNFVDYFRMLRELVEKRLQLWTARQGGADRIVTFGIKETAKIESTIWFDLNKYAITLESTLDEKFIFSREMIYFEGLYYPSTWKYLGSGHKESYLKEKICQEKIADFTYKAISQWKVYHFHDTSDTSGVKKSSTLQDNEYLRSDASNLASFLYKLQQEFPESYENIRNTIQLALPFFGDFVLNPKKLPTEEEQIRLLWKQKDNDYILWPSQLSDGALRFICLVVALLQPKPPSTMIIDEPELGLHPYAITLLGSLLRSVAKRMQIIVSTQSVPLVNEFLIDDLIVVEQEQGKSIFKRYSEEDFTSWLEEYSLGELWQKNILGGRP